MQFVVGLFLADKGKTDYDDRVSLEGEILKQQETSINQTADRSISIRGSGQESRLKIQSHLNFIPAHPANVGRSLSLAMSDTFSPFPTD